jgi:hypothetical protein
MLEGTRTSVRVREGVLGDTRIETYPLFVLISGP